MRSYPTSTCNRNVPKDSFLIAEVQQMSGEIVLTYYSDRDGRLFCTTDWKGDKPAPVSVYVMCRLVGDEWNMLKARIESYYRSKP